MYTPKKSSRKGAKTQRTMNSEEARFLFYAYSDHEDKKKHGIELSKQKPVVDAKFSNNAWFSANSASSA